MLKLALVGKNISHSQSQFVYEKILKTKVNYSLLDFSSEDKIPKALDLFKDFEGVSITSPYKSHFLNEIDVESDIADLKAVNCLKCGKDGKISGTNTDYLALKEILARYLDKTIILLGSGAMFRVCKKILNSLGKDFQNFNRKEHGDISCLDLSKYVNAIVVNCCSRDLIFQGVISQSSIFYDLNYSFKEHKDFFSKQNFQYIDGLELLELQAQYALSYWNIV